MRPISNPSVIGQHAKEEKIDGTKATQARLGSNFSSLLNKEIAYLKRTVRSRQRAKYSSEEETMKKVGEVR